MESTKPLIAVVDDDLSIIKSLARLLRLAGYDVSTFGSAQACLDSIGVASPQCFVIDVQMPEMDGFTLESRLRELHQHVPVVFITAHDTPQTRINAVQRKAFGLLFKPFDPTTFLQAISKAVTQMKPEQNIS